MGYSFEIAVLIVCPLVFLAGFVDSVAGGGGLISIPAYLFAGLPIHTAYGTNKFSACIGTVVAGANYLKSGKINPVASVAGAVAALPGSLLGTLLALYVSAKVLQITLIIILPLVAIFTLTNRRFGVPAHVSPLFPKKLALLSACAGFIIGAYDGFFGPGTGMFLILVFVSFMRLDLVEASGTAKAVNLASNLASVITFIVNGKVLFALAIPAALCAIAGNFLGSRLAIKIGAGFIRSLIAIVAALLCVKIGIDVFFR